MFRPALNKETGLLETIDIAQTDLSKYEVILLNTDDNEASISVNGDAPLTAQETATRKNFVAENIAREKNAIETISKKRKTDVL